MTTDIKPDEYLTESALAELWNVKRNTLQKWRSQGVGPMYIKRVGRIVYRKSDIIAYENYQTHRGTSERVGA
jgi:predicted site-specific integrase-resolvase